MSRGECPALSVVEVGRYIENIVDISIIADIDISVSVSYRYFIHRFFRYIDIVSMTSEIAASFRYFSVVLSPIF